MTMKKDLTGQTIGQYQIIARLGDGTSATVYRAQQLSAFGRDVAIKVMRPELLGEPSFAERLETEARTIANLHHPNILRLIEYVAADDKISLVMDYMPENLADLMKRGLLPFDVIERLAIQIGAALDYAHAHGVIHRDLKPQNVLLDASHNAYLSDFGIAKILSENSSMTRTGAIVGTPAYMSPEQWEGDNLDGRSDIYSFGVMLYELLTGNLPFKADTTTNMMFQHLHTYPVPVETYREDLPPPLNEVILRAIAKRREERFATATELVNTLRDALHGKPIDLGELSPLQYQPSTPIRSAGAGGHMDGSTTEMPVVRQTSPASVRSPSGLILGGIVAVVILGVAALTVLTNQNAAVSPTSTVAALVPTEAVTESTAIPAVVQATVTGGCFTMGSNPQRDLDAAENEMPMHEVCISGFKMDIHEVTYASYQQFVDAGGYSTQANWSEDGWEWLQSSGFAGPEDRAVVADTRLPRVNLSWYEADAYARWRGGRLPTEAEWEYAARGTAERLYSWGDAYQLGYSIINEISRGGTAPTAPSYVGSRPTDRSWAGIYDMVGNACEWVNDWFIPYATAAQTDPTGPFLGNERVIRGGNYTSSPTTARLVARSSRPPEERARLCGVRVVSEVQD